MSRGVVAAAAKHREGFGREMARCSLHVRFVYVLLEDYTLLSLPSAFPSAPSPTTHAAKPMAIHTAQDESLEKVSL